MTTWIADVRKFANPNSLILLVGNKSDLDEQRKVQAEAAVKLAAHYDVVIDVLETSAKSSRNVDEAFRRLASELVSNAGGLASLYDDKSIQLDKKSMSSESEDWCSC